jgi:hypothetical protein
MKDVDHAEQAEARHAKVRDSRKFDDNSHLVTPLKAVDKAMHVHEKAISKEHKMAGKLAKAERAHDSAPYHVQDTAKSIQVRSEADRRNLSNLTAATAIE